ncbi:MAG: hypothetical protein V4436_03440 [Patescibacteria group bacterium]
MRFRSFLLIGIASLGIAASSPSFAAGNAVGKTLQGLAALTGDRTVGNLISGTIYGNTSNPSGNGNGVLPSWAPGPHVCGTPGDCAGETGNGSSMGGLIAPIVSGGQADPDFNAQPHDFSAPHL